MSTAIKIEPRSFSPVVPGKDVAHEPKEWACQNAGSIKQELKEELDSISPVSEQEVPKTPEIKIKPEVMDPVPSTSVNDDEDSRDSINSGLLTEAMLEEERRLHNETMKEEERLRKEALAQLTDDQQENYKKLNYLLEKSNCYTTYLLQRMDRQKLEEQQRRERQQKRVEKKKEEVKKVVEKEIISPKRSSRLTTKESPKALKSKKSTQATDEKPKRGRKRGKVDETSDKPDNIQEEDKGAKKAKIDGAISADENESLESSQNEEDALKKGRVIFGQDVPEEQPLLFTGGVLRQYQIDGFQWMKLLYENGVNGILADEMGLGKTAQCIAGICDLVYHGIQGPYLVVAPLSTLPNWVSEFARFAPQVPVILYHGAKEDRERKRSKMIKLTTIKEGIVTKPVVITSYEIAMKDRKYIGNFGWKYLVIDEGHRIKNFQCRLIRELKLYKTTNRLLLTGTPLQNNLSELWSLLNFLLPEIFDDLGSFEAWFDVDAIASGEAEEEIIAKEKQKNILSSLHQILTPFMLRRMKCDVDLMIPPKREVLVYAPLTDVQKDFYEATVNKSIFNLIDEKNKKQETVELDKNGRPLRRVKKVDYEVMLEDKKSDEDDDIDSWVEAVVKQQQDRESVRSTPKAAKKKSVVSIRLQNVMMQLRKVCNHPYLLEYPLDGDGNYLVTESLVANSGKMMLLEKMLHELHRTGHKVLIYSQMTSMLDILEDYCGMRQYEYCRLDGSRSVEDRKEQIEKFNTDDDVFIFLLSTRAGGLGINLVSADTVIVYDSDWNPQCDLQAQDRCHRIGQTRPVMVYRLVTKNTIDQRIVERARGKRRLEKMVIQKGKFKSGLKNFDKSLNPLSPEELLVLLKSQDHATVIEGQDGQVISKKDLKKLLDRSDLYKIWEEKKGTKSPRQKPKGKKSTNSDVKEDVEGIFTIINTNEDAE